LNRPENQPVPDISSLEGEQSSAESGNSTPTSSSSGESATGEVDETPESMLRIPSTKASKRTRLIDDTTHTGKKRKKSIGHLPALPSVNGEKKIVDDRTFLLELKKGYLLLIICLHNYNTF